MSASAKNLTHNIPMKKALFFSPYLNNPGGGEVYCLNFAKCLNSMGYEIVFAWNDQLSLNNTLSLLDIKFDYEIDKKAFALFTGGGNLISKFFHFRKYDINFAVSDGSLPFLFGRQNILHFQVPFTFLKPTLPNKLKLSNINYVVTNSKFTKNFIDQGLGVNSVVIYPPINFQNPSVKTKEKIILSVGRFTDTLHNKRQDVLGETFKSMVDDGLKDWRLVIIGSTSQKESGAFVDKLKSESKDYPITVITNAGADIIRSYYAKSQIFWLATGYGVDEQAYPESVEHFGIVTVESMNSGCVPLAVGKGGQKEIIRDGENGFLFETKEELASKTKTIISNPNLFSKLSKQAVEDSKAFTLDQFNKNIAKIIG